MEKSANKIVECGYAYSAKQQRFVAEYIVDFDQKRAAIDAGYSVNTAATAAGKLLVQKKIQVLIKKMRGQDEKQRKLRRNDVLDRVEQNLNRDLNDLCGKGGYFVSKLKDIPTRAHAWIDGFKVKQFFDRERNLTHQTIEIKLCPNATIQDMGMKHIGAYAPVKQEVASKVALDFDQLTRDHSNDNNPVEEKLEQLEKK